MYFVAIYRDVWNSIVLNYEIFEILCSFHFLCRRCKECFNNKDRIQYKNKVGEHNYNFSHFYYKKHVRYIYLLLLVLNIFSQNKKSTTKIFLLKSNATYKANTVDPHPGYHNFGDFYNPIYIFFIIVWNVIPNQNKCRDILF